MRFNYQTSMASFVMSNNYQTFCLYFSPTRRKNQYFLLVFSITETARRNFTLSHPWFLGYQEQERLNVPDSVETNVLVLFRWEVAKIGTVYKPKNDIYGKIIMFPLSVLMTLFRTPFACDAKQIVCTNLMTCYTN